MIALTVGVQYVIKLTRGGNMWSKFIEWALEHNHDHKYRLLEDMNLEECMICHKLIEREQYQDE